LMGRRDQPARLLALHLWGPSDRPSVERRRALQSQGSSPLEPLLGRARDLMLEVRRVEFVSEDPGADICRTAEAMSASLILVAAPRPLLREGDLGRVVRKVVAAARRPVGVFIDRGLTNVSRVLVPLLGEEEDLAALHLARRIVAAPGVHLTLLQLGEQAAAN